MKSFLKNIKSAFSGGIKKILVRLLSITFNVRYDYLMHFVAGWTISTAMSVIVQNQNLSVFLVPIVTLLIAILKELGDKYIKKTEFSITDIAFTVGPAIAYFIVLVIK